MDLGEIRSIVAEVNEFTRPTLSPYTRATYEAARQPMPFDYLIRGLSSAVLASCLVFDECLETRSGIGYAFPSTVLGRGIRYEGAPEPVEKLVQDADRAVRATWGRGVISGDGYTMRLGAYGPSRRVTAEFLRLAWLRGDLAVDFPRTIHDL